MTPEELEKSILATDEECFPFIAQFIMQHNPKWMSEYQAFLDMTSREFIPFIQQNKGAGKSEIFFKDVERAIEGKELKGFVYVAILNLILNDEYQVVKSYELFFPTDKSGEPTGIMSLARRSEQPH